jgi:hypothetical protein
MDDDAPLTPPADTASASDSLPSWHANGSSNGSSATRGSNAAPEIATDRGSDGDDEAFLGELARAMKGAAAAERGRVAEDTDRRRADHIASIHARRDSEAQRIRELAEQDRNGIDAWAQAELQRIQQERERRTAGVEDDLQKSLSEHRTRIEWEIARVEEAITSYRSEVDAFFASLDRETDPVAIAQHAGRRPAFPALDALTATLAPAPSAPADAGDATDATAAGEPGATADAETQADPVADATTPAPEAESDTIEPVAVGPGLDTSDASDTETPSATDEATATPDAADEPVATTDAGTDSETAPAEAPAAAEAATSAADAEAPAPVAEASASVEAGTGVEAMAEVTPVVASIDTSPETTGIGVMEPLSSQKLAEAWAAWNRSTAAADDRLLAARRAVERAEGDAAAEAAAEVGSNRPAGAYVEPGDAVGAAASGDNRGNAPFSSGPGFARMSWLRRDKDHSAG